MMLMGIRYDMNPYVKAFLTGFWEGTGLEKYNPVTRYEGALGITLWRWNRKKVEIWFAKKDYSPQEHAHDGCDGEFMVLYSKNRRIYRKTMGDKPEWSSDYNCWMIPRFEIHEGDEYIANTPQVWGKWLTVPAGVPHKFDTGDSCMIWLVVEKWREGYDMSLVSDFRVTE